MLDEVFVLVVFDSSTVKASGADADTGSRLLNVVCLFCGLSFELGKQYVPFGWCSL